MGVRGGLAQRGRCPRIPSRDRPRPSLLERGGLEKDCTGCPSADSGCSRWARAAEIGLPQSICFAGRGGMATNLNEQSEFIFVSPFRRGALESPQGIDLVQACLREEDSERFEQGASGSLLGLRRNPPLFGRAKRSRCPRIPSVVRDYEEIPLHQTRQTNKINYKQFNTKKQIV